MSKRCPSGRKIRTLVLGVGPIHQSVTVQPVPEAPFLVFARTLQVDQILPGVGTRFSRQSKDGGRVLPAPVKIVICSEYGFWITCECPYLTCR
jgi:hypothetical protein